MLSAVELVILIFDSSSVVTSEFIRLIVQVGRSENMPGAIVIEQRPPDIAPTVEIQVPLWRLITDAAPFAPHVIVARSTRSVAPLLVTDAVVAVALVAFMQ